MGAQTRQVRGVKKRRGEGRMIRGSRGSEKIITAIVEVGHLKLWLHNECKSSVGSNSR